MISPPELNIRSSATESSLYCNAKAKWKNSSYKLVTELELFPRKSCNIPTVESIEEQINSTTIRRRIFPNGHIGTGWILCHWDGYKDYGTRANLYIGEHPGKIQLKEQCRAYDHRYVECIFHAPIIARAFRNGYPRIYHFTAFNHDSSIYLNKNTGLRIAKNNDLVLRFTPRDRNKISPSTPMLLNVTLWGFGSLLYPFKVEPTHTTIVDFQLRNISSKQFDIHIHQNTISGTTDVRLCSGHVNQIINQTASEVLRSIRETSEHVIPIRHLRPLSHYNICLSCYYERTDASFNEKKCRTVRTTGLSYPESMFGKLAYDTNSMSYFTRWYLAATATIVAVLLLMLAAITILIIKRHFRSALTLDLEISSQQQNDHNVPSQSNVRIPTDDTALPLASRTLLVLPTRLTNRSLQSTLSGISPVASGRPSLRDSRNTSSGISAREIVNQNDLSLDTQYLSVT